MTLKKRVSINIRPIFTSFFCVLMIFFCRYEIWFNFLPITMLRLFQMLGIGYVFLLTTQQKFYVAPQIGRILSYSLFFSLIAFLSSMLAGQGLAMFRFMMNMLLFLGISFFIIKQIKRSEGEIQIGRLLDFWLYASILQLTISCFFFINNNVYEWMTSFINLSETASSRNELINIRIIGLGNAFFGAGFNYSTDLLVMALLPYVKGSKIYHNKIFYWSLLALVLGVGILSARTFFIGIVIAILFVCYNERKQFGRLIIRGIGSVIVLTVLLMSIFGLLSKYIDSFEYIMSWAFEMFINFFTDDTITTSSSNKMMEMYIFPENTATWLWGDGIMENADGTYYKETDIGFIRLIFFWGAPLTLCWYLFRYYCVRVIYKNSNLPILTSFSLSYLALEYLCNFKGLVFGDFFLAYLLIFILYFNRVSNA